MNQTKNKLRIVYISHIYLPHVGGLEKTLYHLSDHLKKDGHTISFIVPRDPPEAPLFEIINGIPVYRIEAPRMLANLLKKVTFSEVSFRTKTAIKNFRIMFGLIRKLKPQIVHIHNLHTLMTYTLLLSYIFRFKLIVSIQGFPVLELPSLPWYNKWIFKLILLRADHVTACSSCMLRDTAKMVPAIRTYSTPIHNGIDLEEFKYHKQYVHAKPYILSIANLHWYKGTDILIMAFARIASQYPDIDLILVGDGSFKDKRMGLAEVLGIASRVIFTGKISSRTTIIEYINGCEFFVLPSRYEPFGIANLEAMAAGKAVITTDAGGCPEVVQHKTTGIVVKAKNDAALAEAIVELINNKTLREEYGRAGHKLVEEFTWDKIYQRYMRVYQNIMG